MKAYCFVPEERVEEITECGIELSLGQYYACRVTSNDGMCLMGRLNPRDYDESEFSQGKVLVKVNLNKVRSFIGEGVYLKLDTDDTVKFHMFEDSLLPGGEYRLGTYREPLCLIVNAVLPEAVETYDRLIDEAVPYENSGELYVECLFSDIKDRDDSFREIALNAYLEHFTRINKIEKIQYGDYSIYKTDNTSYILKRG